MLDFTFTNVNAALPLMLHNLYLHGETTDSRNGKVLRFTQPIGITYTNPRERVLFDPKRNANPFFHFFESLWMLAGRNDVKFCTQFVARMKEYSDNGTTFHGAYGFRWREHFGYDQLAAIVAELKENPNSRRCVLAMWDATMGILGVEGDLGTAMGGGKDVPCNTHIYFEVQRGYLNMTVCNRSNDLLWGALGANVVHMSMLQEYIANASGYEVGTYTQFSNNMHVYLDVLPTSKFGDFNNCDLYPTIDPFALVPLIDTDVGETMADFDADLQQFFDVYDLNQYIDNGVDYITGFFNKVVEPMASAWKQRNLPNMREGDWNSVTGDIASADWRYACEAWLQRRHDRAKVVKA
jgi:hypothetical protein